MQPSVLVTGATGFVGRALVEEMVCGNRRVIAVVRQKKEGLLGQAAQYPVGDLSSDINWSDTLRGVDVVIHLAARVHVMQDEVLNPLAEFRKINTVATLNLAKQAVKAGVKRFIFLSTIKVNGEETAGLCSYPEGGEAKAVFVEADDFTPTDPYGLSKQEAEQGLFALAKETGMEVVIIRPPLVYGPAVRANFGAMVQWVNRGVPLPFGAIYNRRSLVALENLTSFIIHCINHPKAANEVFLISDDEDVSTTQLLKKVAKAFGKKAFLLPVPVCWMRFAAKIIGKAGVANRLFGSLQVDSSKARDLLEWKPVITMDLQLKKIAEVYLNEKTV